MNETEAQEQLYVIALAAAKEELARVQRELDHKKMWANEIAACAKEELEKAHKEIERVKAQLASARNSMSLAASGAGKDWLSWQLFLAEELQCTDAGTGYVRKEDVVEALEGALVICQCFADGQEASPGFMDNNDNVIRIKDALAKSRSGSVNTGYVRKEDVRPLLAVIESAVKNCFFCRGTGAISKAADRMSADPPPLPHECQDCKPLREALAHAQAKGLTEHD